MLLHRIKRHSIALLVLITLIVYIPSFFGGYVWDDEDFVYSNTYVRNQNISAFFTQNAIAGRGKISNYYRPLQLASYSIEYKLSGGRPWLLHVSNVVWQAAAGVVLFAVLSYLSIPWFLRVLASVVFLIHPIQTEAVTYISGRPDIMMVFFLMMSALVLFMRKRWYLTISLVFFLLALLSKESGLIGVVLLPFFVLWYNSMHKASRISLRKIIPHIVIGIVYLLIRFTVLSFDSIEALWRGSLYGSSVVVRTATFFQNFFMYLKIIIAPVVLHMERDLTVPIVKSITSLWTPAYISTQTLFLFIIFLTYKHSPKYGIHAFFSYIVWSAVMLFYSGIILLNGIFYEHYMYLAIPFFFIMLFSFAFAWIKGRHMRSVIVVFVMLYIVLLIVRNIVRQYDWTNAVRFYKSTLAYAPKSIRVLNGLGMALSEQGKLNEAIQIYKKALSVSPNNPVVHHNIGNAYRYLGNTKAAQKHYLKALRADNQFIFSYQALYELYMKSGDSKKQVELADSIIRINRPQPQLLLIAARLYEQNNKPQKAIDSYTQLRSLVGNNSQLQLYIDRSIKRLLYQQDQ